MTEGNYLLLDRPEWRRPAAALDEVWFVRTEPAPAARAAAWPGTSRPARRRRGGRAVGGTRSTSRTRGWSRRRAARPTWSSTSPTGAPDVEPSRCQSRTPSLAPVELLGEPGRVTRRPREVPARAHGNDSIASAGLTDVGPAPVHRARREVARVEPAACRDAARRDEAGTRGRLPRGCPTGQLTASLDVDGGATDRVCGSSDAPRRGVEPSRLRRRCVPHEAAVRASVGMVVATRTPGARSGATRPDTTRPGRRTVSATVAARPRPAHRDVRGVAER